MHWKICDPFYFREAQKLAKLWDCPFYETSPKESFNIDEVFQAAIQRIEALKPSNNKSSCSIM